MNMMIMSLLKSVLRAGVRHSSCFFGFSRHNYQLSIINLTCHDSTRLSSSFASFARSTWLQRTIGLIIVGEKFILSCWCWCVTIVGPLSFTLLTGLFSYAGRGKHAACSRRRCLKLARCNWCARTTNSTCSHCKAWARMREREEAAPS